MEGVPEEPDESQMTPLHQKCDSPRVPTKGGDEWTNSVARNPPLSTSRNKHPLRMSVDSLNNKDKAIRDLRAHNSMLSEGVAGLQLENTNLKEQLRARTRLREQHSEMLKQMRALKQQVQTAEAEKAEAIASRDTARRQAKEIYTRATMAKEKIRLHEQRFLESSSVMERLNMTIKVLHKNLLNLMQEVTQASDDTLATSQIVGKKAVCSVRNNSLSKNIIQRVDEMQALAETTCSQLVSEVQRRGVAERKLEMLEMQMVNMRAQLNKAAKGKGRMAGSEIAISLAQHDYAIQSIQSEVDCERQQKEMLLAQLNLAHKQCMEYSEQQSAMAQQAKQSRMAQGQIHQQVYLLQEELQILKQGIRHRDLGEPTLAEQSPAARDVQLLLECQHAASVEDVKPDDILSASRDSGGSEASSQECVQEVCTNKHTNVTSLKNETSTYHLPPSPLQVTKLPLIK